MSTYDSPNRPIRERKPVATYNLKALTGRSRNTRKGHANDRQPRDPRNQAMSLGERDGSTSTDSTPARKRRRSNSVSSSDLTSPMPSPGLSALESSFNLESRKPAKRHSRTNSIDSKSTVIPLPSVYDCFNFQNKPRGHYYSAKQLCARGVWIGYLAPEKQTASFSGLPSFKDLKVNYNKRGMPMPHPPAIRGTVYEGDQQRFAACRGCVEEGSTVITLLEIEFVKQMKLMAMPLDGDDGAGTFCIMLPQIIDKSFQGLVQSYRPYEIINNGMGKLFNNNFMLLTLYNPDQNSGTIETVLTVLSQAEQARIKERTSRASKLGSSKGAATDPMSCAIKMPTLLPPMSTIRFNNDKDTIHDESPLKRKRQQYSPVDLPECTYTTRVGARSDSDIATHSPIRQPSAQASILKTPQQPSDPCDICVPPSQFTNTLSVHYAMPPGPTDDQARRILFVWTVNDGGIDNELEHTLSECKTFDGLLALLQEDTEDHPAATALLNQTKRWRLRVALPGGGEPRGFVMRKGDNGPFERLMSHFADSNAWSENPHKIVEMQLEYFGQGKDSATKAEAIAAPAYFP